MKTIDKSLIASLIRQAKESPRKRAHFNLHPGLEDPVQRLCVAAEQGSYIPPHRHPEPYKWELFIILRGLASVLFFDDDGIVTDRRELNAESGSFAVEIPPQTWHTLVIETSETVLIEIKPGPYYPLSDKDFAGWAPDENNEGAVNFERILREAQQGASVSLM